MKPHTLLLSAFLLLCGCTSSTDIVIGPQHPPIPPDQVKLVIVAPAGAEELALLTSESRRRGQSGVNACVQDLRERAGALGANYLLITDTTPTDGGMVGTVLPRSGLIITTRRRQAHIDAHALYVAPP